MLFRFAESQVGVMRNGEEDSISTLSTRVGGLFLLLAGVALPIIVIDYMTTMSGLVSDGYSPSADERVTFARSVFGHLAVGWHAEVFAMALLGAGALALSNRVSRAGWSLSVMGCVVAIPMYAVMVGGYGGLFEQTTSSIELFEILNGIAGFSFIAGQGLVHLGLGVAFLIEARVKPSVAPAWMLLLAAATNLLGACIFILNHVGVLNSFVYAGPFGLVGHILVAIFGFKLLIENPAKET